MKNVAFSLPESTLQNIEAVGLNSRTSKTKLYLNKTYRRSNKEAHKETEGAQKHNVH